MIEEVKGHRYRLKNLKSDGETILQFYQDAEIHGVGVEGPSTQEVLRACIARVIALNDEESCEQNAAILFHLRSAIAQFEVRALLRQVSKGRAIENRKVFPNGHLIP